MSEYGDGASADGGSVEGESSYGGSNAGGGMMESRFAKNMNLPHVFKTDHISPATRLLEKRRQMYEVQQELDLQKREFSKKEEVFKYREEGLQRKNLEILESLARFAKFLEENAAKRNRAEKKAAEELKLREEKEVEIGHLKEAIKELRGVREETRTTVDRNLIYSTFLLSVVNQDNSFEETAEVINRHNTLLATNEDLTQLSLKFAKEQEAVREKMGRYIKEQTDKVLNMQNQIGVLTKVAESKELRGQQVEGNREANRNTLKDRTKEYGQSLHSIENIFFRCRSNATVSHKLTYKPLEQLETIHEFVSDSEHIVKLVRASRRGQEQTVNNT